LHLELAAIAVCFVSLRYTSLDAGQGLRIVTSNSTETSKFQTRLQKFKTTSGFGFIKIWGSVSRISEIRAISYVRAAETSRRSDSTSRVGIARHPTPCVLGCTGVPDAHKQAWQPFYHEASVPENLTGEGMVHRHP
jgi:hypothetical protein